MPLPPSITAPRSVEAQQEAEAESESGGICLCPRCGGNDDFHAAIGVILDHLATLEPGAQEDLVNDLARTFSRVGTAS